MEELVTLQYGSFTILGEQVREYAQMTSCPNWVTNRTLWGQLYLSELRRKHPGWNATQYQEWGLFLLEGLLHNTVSIRGKEHQRHPQAPQAKMAEVTAPEHPTIRTLLGSTDAEISRVDEKVYWGEYVIAPSVLPFQQQEECIRELHLELAQHMARAGLQSRPRSARPTSQSRGCSHSQASFSGASGGRGSQTSQRRPFYRAIKIMEVMFPLQV